VQPLTQHRLASNAYRTLGLSASAGASAIEAAARRMRIWPDPSRIPPTTWDLPELGPLQRSRSAIEQAVTLLREPSSRLEERLLWFHGSKPPGEDSPGEGWSPAKSHDAAVAELHRVFRADPNVSQAGQWWDAISRFNSLSADPAYLDWIARSESDGGFEKAPTPFELDQAAQFVPDAIYAALIPKAEASLDRGDLTAFDGIVSLLSSKPHGDDDASLLQPLLDRMEDKLHSRCEEIDKALRDKLLTNRQQPEPYFERNRAATYDAALAYSRNIKPLLAHVLEVAADDTDRTTRVRTECGLLSQLIAMGWEWAGHFAAAYETIHAAVKLVEGLPIEPTIRKDLDKYALLVQPKPQQQNRQAWVTRGVEANLPMTQTSTSGAIESNWPARGASTGRGKAAKKQNYAWIWILLVAASSALRVINGGNDGKSTSSPTPMPAIDSKSFAPVGTGVDKELLIPPTPRAPTSQPNWTPSIGEVNREP
jgi:hypothetical protein